MGISHRIVATVLVASGGAFAAGVPSQLVYQGRLLKADGSAVTQPMTLTFALYDSPSSAVPLWSETHSVSPTDGFFEVSLGDGPSGDVPLASVIDGRELWLGIKAGSDAEMTPRTPLASAPYAMLASPVAHAQTHMKGGGDEIASYAASQDRIPMAGPGGTLDQAWIPLLPLSKGGTGTATPRTTRNLCVYVAAPDSVAPPPTLPLPPDLTSCVAVKAFASARQATTANWTFLVDGKQLFPPLAWAGTTRKDDDLPGGISLDPRTVISPSVVEAPSFVDATFCLQISCAATF